MAKMMGPRFKQCRRLGLNVCDHPKAMERATKFNSREANKLSDYGKQLLEKQRLRAYYGVLEKQFKRYAEKAIKSRTITGDALIISLECRLDNFTNGSGFAVSYIETDADKLTGKFLKIPERSEVPIQINEQLVVEFYSKTL